MITIDYYSDVLCVWAWIAQRRIDELNNHFGDQIFWRYRYVDIFGDSQSKMQNQWADRGLYRGFGEHVQSAAAAYENAPVNPKLWQQLPPKTSANAHMLLKAAEHCHGSDTAVRLALTLRRAFFVDAVDIGDLDKLLAIAADSGCDRDEISATINSGCAIAALLKDYQSAREQSIKGSPSYVLDGGRQVLYGNVGYRVLQANIEELLKQPAEEASWC